MFAGMDKHNWTLTSNIWNVPNIYHINTDLSLALFMGTCAGSNVSNILKSRNDKKTRQEHSIPGCQNTACIARMHPRSTASASGRMCWEQPAFQNIYLILSIQRFANWCPHQTNPLSLPMLEHDRTQCCGKLDRPQSLESSIDHNCVQLQKCANTPLP